MATLIYTGHLVWNRLLAIIYRCLLHKTHPECGDLAIPCTGQFWLPQTRFIKAGYDVFGVVWQIKIGLHLNREHNELIILETEPQNYRIAGYFRATKFRGLLKLLADFIFEDRCSFDHNPTDFEILGQPRKPRKFRASKITRYTYI